MVDIKPIRSRYPLDILSDDELKAIQAGTLQILEQVGVRFPSAQALQTFNDYGAEVDWDQNIVRLPANLVQQTMEKAPRVFKLNGRSAGSNLQLDGTSSYFGTDGCGVETVDFYSRELRASRKEDVAMMARISDALSSISFYWPMVSAQDCGETAALHELEASFINTSKHVQSVTATNELLAKHAIKMAEIVAGDKKRMREAPPLSALICTIAPLSQDKDAIEAALTFAEAGIPVGFMSMPTLGSTAPATSSGALVVGNAEIVSAMVLMQLAAPGAPVFYSLCASVIDPQTAAYLISLPEKYKCNTAGIQLAHDWRVPVLAGVFAMDSPDPATWRLGRDSVYTALMAAMAGADLAEGLGMVKASTRLVPEQIIFDDEIYHTHRVLTEGIEAGGESMALDDIAAVGPGGHFLAQKHTRKHIREIWFPELSHPRLTGVGQPSDDIRQRARTELRRILAGHETEPLDNADQVELSKVIKAAEQEYSRL